MRDTPGSSRLEPVGWFVLYPQVEVHRVDELLHRRLAYAAHVFAALANAFRLYDFKFMLEFAYLFHACQALIAVGDIHHNHSYTEEYVDPMLYEVVDREQTSVDYPQYYVVAIAF